jgi:hypothetical protein
MSKRGVFEQANPTFSPEEVSFIVYRHAISPFREA